MEEKLDSNLKTEKKVGYCNPPNRFSSTNQPKHHPGRPKGISLTTLLKKCLEKNIKYIDPETQQMIKGKVKDAIVWRLILNATQGEDKAIKEVFERIDGKVVQELKGEGFGGNTIFIYPPNWKPKDERIKNSP